MKLYHGSPFKIEGSLQPILEHSTLEHVHTKPAVFATERLDIAALFMFPLEVLASIGFEQDIGYICVWGTLEEFLPHDKGGFVYVLPPETFEKIGKEYEWQSFAPVLPVEVRQFNSVIEGMMECGAQVYFINDNAIFDRIVAEKNNRAPILKDLISENQKRGVFFKVFS